VDTGLNIQVLDHGYLKLVRSWGSDEEIVEDARMSVDGGFVSWEPYEKHPKGDLGLLTRLYTSRHTSPFEGSGLKFEVQCPIFVAREWMRHRTQSYSEHSARYSELPNRFYIPSLERLMGGKQSTTNKQASSEKAQEGFSEAQAWGLGGDLTYATQRSWEAYQRLLKAGLSRELARLVIPVNIYTRFRTSANLHNWLHFLGLRLDKAAQWEIRQYAMAIASIVQKLFPRTYDLFNEQNKPTWKKSLETQSPLKGILLQGA
jgi:thymidylate synthase (FAD)